eukprot:TRINITY_DN38448_c0_g1_i1.p1 TRINITY_DN38448_c0_g1~~TRINITY_DN38448_c0_g1_i1.p1  ORF type:complete len:629 (-),score=60.95 TRINITY_DN38448_c0_g1_i1:188-2074(-)
METSNGSPSRGGSLRLPESVLDDDGRNADESELAKTDHLWNYKYNRRLGVCSQAITSVTFSPDGSWFVSCTGGGEVKMWSTATWAESCRLKHTTNEEVRAIVISPTQRWLLTAYASELRVFHCEPPWKLDASVPVHSASGKQSEWYCVTFSPMVEVDHTKGFAGSDYFLAAFSTDTLTVIDYSGGWGEGHKRRTRSLPELARPTSLAYTNCGWWLLCAFEHGHIQVWNAFSLMLERTVCAHSGRIHGIITSPKGAPYATRAVSCGADQALRVWDSAGWVLEQNRPDTRCFKAGIRSCLFSTSGKWLLSVAQELSVWRVVLSDCGKHLSLRIHQRLQAVCGSETIRSAAFCPKTDAIAAGSQDGFLGLWIKHEGPPHPLTSPITSPANRRSARQMSSPSKSPGLPLFEREKPPLARPMRKITPDQRLDQEAAAPLASTVQFFPGGTSAAAAMAVPVARPVQRKVSVDSSELDCARTVDLSWLQREHKRASSMNVIGGRHQSMATLQTLPMLVTPANKLSSSASAPGLGRPASSASRGGEYAASSSPLGQSVPAAASLVRHGFTREASSGHSPLPGSGSVVRSASLRSELLRQTFPRQQSPGPAASLVRRIALEPQNIQALARPPRAPPQ